MDALSEHLGEIPFMLTIAFLVFFLDLNIIFISLLFFAIILFLFVFINHI